MSAKKTQSKEKHETSFKRPPVVVVLGHVDHGKTTLLDTIRKTSIANFEHGGITQKIGAYQITSPETITFIDTPGHEAFAKMRSRGTSVADIAILVVAANDSVKPQTIESIKIIKDAKIPYIVAINKTDLPESNVDKTIKDLLRFEVLLEKYGGDVPFVQISAKTGDKIPDLLELINLMYSLNENFDSPEKPLNAIIIESKLDKNRGPLATAIVKNGTLLVGSEIYVNNTMSKIRALLNENSEQISKATPGMPVQILGLTIVPTVGSIISGEKTVPTKNQDELEIIQKSYSAENRETTLDIILYCDTIGSLEAITQMIPENVRLLKSATGEITDSDILLAKSTGAIILGFNTKSSPSSLKLAETEKVLVRTYKIIYELLDELKDAAVGLLKPEINEEVLGKAKIIASFPYEKMLVAGCKVKDGRLAKGDLIKIIRDEEEIGRSKIKSIRVLKEEITKVESPKECGVFLDPQIDFHINDDIIVYRLS